MPASTITIFVATARSATQWLARTLQTAYPDLLVVRHEPIRYAYRPKHFLRARDLEDDLPREPRVADHLRWIRQVLTRSSYVEVGFPVYAAAPFFLAEFGHRLRVVHLTRDPLRVAASLVTHQWYVKGRDDDLHE